MIRPVSTIFLDRDGIINEVVARDEIISSPRTLDEFHIRHDFIEFYDLIHDRAINLFVVSNQPDVRRGHLSDANLKEMTQQIRDRFSLSEIIYCKHDDADNCECRKPKPGMILELLKKYDLPANEAIIIGDSYKDILAGQAAGIRTIYCCQSYNAMVSCEPDYQIQKLTDLFELGLLGGS